MTKNYNKTVQEKVGRQIKMLRLENGLSQEELAFRVGIDRTYISFIERGLRSPRIHQLYRIAYVLNVKPGALLPDINDSPNNE